MTVTSTHEHHITTYDLSAIFKDCGHGRGAKHLMTLHETVSKDIAGLVDIVSVAKGMAKEGLAVHGMTDAEGHQAWSHGHGTTTYYHAGGVNSISNGIENVSWIPVLLQSKTITKEQAWRMWLHRDNQLNATARLLAAWHNSDKKNHPLRFVDGDGAHEGVTSHWNVSQHHKESDGHGDCWPHHLGGYYPILLVIDKAKAYADQGYVF